MTILGKVTQSLDAVIPIQVRSSAEKSLQIDAVIDSGFNGTLAISKALAEQLKLEPLGVNEATLADGRIATLQFCKLAVDWHGGSRELAAWIVEKGCLVGMELLEGSRLQIDVVPSGEVSVTHSGRS
jgi:clan AA aspartic protease